MEPFVPPDTVTNKDWREPAGASLAPPRVKRAIQKELSPGETVERILQPRSASPGWIRVRAAVTLGTTLAACLLSLLFRAPQILPLIGGIGLVILLAHVTKREGARGLAYVVTNQRCFRILAPGEAASVREVTESPNSELATEDREWLRDRLLNPSSISSPADDRLKEVARPGIGALPPDLARVLTISLEPGESVLWASQPRPWSYLGTGPVGTFYAFGIVVGVILLFAAAVLAAVAQVAPHGLVMAAELFGVVGSAALGSSTALLWRRLRRTVYAVTDRRAMILIPGRRPTVFALEEIAGFQRSQGTGGHGALVHPDSRRNVGFYGIDHVKDVSDLIHGRVLPDRSGEVVPTVAEGTGREVTSERPER